MATLKNTKILGSSTLQLPSGNTAQRPSLTASDRTMRYNTDLDGNGRVIGTETWNGSLWSPVGGGVAQVEPNYTIQSFTNAGSATFNVPVGINFVHVLVVAGGGAGGTLGGGGGAGGFVEVFDYPVTPGGTVPVVVGQGGTAYGGYLAPGGTSLNSGNPSAFGNIVAVGGGAGAAHPGDNRFSLPQGSGTAGQPGGSGGGASYANTTNGSAQNTTWGYQGYPGGGAPGSPPHSSGGGGGAGSAGCPTGPGFGRGGTGGQGRSSWITGQQTWFAGGGGGGGHGPQSSAGYGGLGGGGAGSGSTIAESGQWKTFLSGYAPPSPGAKNTGGGGGGGGHTGSNPYGSGGNGGPGIVIVRF